MEVTAMTFDGKATYDDFDSIYEDVSDIVSINSPKETPLLDALGNPDRAAISTQVDWLEDALLAKTDQLAEALDASEPDIDVDDVTKFAIGDLFVVDEEVFMVTALPGAPTLTCTRGYGSSTAATHADNATVYILGHAALEGADIGTPKTTNRTRVSNYVQILRSKPIKVSHTENRVSQIGGDVEYDHQKNQRIIEVMRDLESIIISGTKAASTPGGSDAVRRTLQGIKWFCSSNVEDLSAAALLEATLEGILQDAWDAGAQDLDLMLCGSFNKGKISRYAMATALPTRLAANVDAGAGTYAMHPITLLDTQYGLIRVLPACRWIPPAEALILSSKHIQVKPLQGGSFQHVEIAPGGSYRQGYIEGEYTIEVRHEEAHVWIKDTSIA